MRCVRVECVALERECSSVVSGRRDRAGPGVNTWLLVAVLLDQVLKNFERCCGWSARARTAASDECDDAPRELRDRDADEGPLEPGGYGCRWNDCGAEAVEGQRGEQANPIDLGLRPKRDVSIDCSAFEHLAKSCAHWGEEKWDLVEVAQRDRVAASEGMVLVSEKEKVLGKERFDHEFRIIDRQVDDGGIELAT